MHDSAYEKRDSHQRECNVIDEKKFLEQFLVSKCSKFAEHCKKKKEKCSENEQMSVYHAKSCFPGEIKEFCKFSVENPSCHGAEKIDDRSGH